MKTTIIYILSTIITISAYSQSKFGIFKVSSGPWNELHQEYNLSENLVNMTGEINSQVLRIGDRMNSTYFLTNHEVVRDDYKMRVDEWQGVDEKGRNCRILVGKNRQGSDKTITVVYEDYVFNYFIYY